MNRTRYIIAYDVQSNRMRRKLAKLLEGYGERMQLSVFEAELSRDELAELLARSEEWIAPGDSLRAYATCASCRSRVASLGRWGGGPDTGMRII